MTGAGRIPLIRRYLEELTEALGGIGSALKPETQALVYSLSANDLPERIALTLGLLMQLTVKEGARGKENALAWVRTPRDRRSDGSHVMPVYGSLRLRPWPASIYITPELLRCDTDLRISVIAHEISRLILYSWCPPDWPDDLTPGHPLQHSAAAGDIVAMLLGYRDIYIKAYRGRNYTRPTVDANVTDTYLTSTEVEYLFDELARRPAKELSASGLTGRALAGYGDFTIGPPDKSTQYRAVPPELIATPWRMPIGGD
jgi:hypothetical protein